MLLGVGMFTALPAYRISPLSSETGPVCLCNTTMMHDLDATKARGCSNLGRLQITALSLIRTFEIKNINVALNETQLRLKESLPSACNRDRPDLRNIDKLKSKRNSHKRQRVTSDIHPFPPLP